MNPSLSGRILLGHFGNPSELPELARKHDLNITYFQVRKWLERDRVPADGLLALLQLGQRIGKPVDLIGMIEDSAW
jgi:hypothetical protein